MAKTNPLDKYVTSEPSSFPRDFKIPTMPSLRDALSGRNLLEAAAHLDAQNEQFRKSFEQAIAERIRQTSATTTTTAATIATIPTQTPQATASAAAADVDLSDLNSQLSALRGQMADMGAQVQTVSATANAALTAAQAVPVDLDTDLSEGIEELQFQVGQMALSLLEEGIDISDDLEIELE